MAKRSVWLVGTSLPNPKDKRVFASERGSPVVRLSGHEAFLIA